MVGCLIDRTCSPFSQTISEMTESLRRFRRGTLLICLAGMVIGPAAALGGLMPWTHGLIETALWGLSIIAVVLILRRATASQAWGAFCAAGFAVAFVSAHELFPAWAVTHQVADEASELNSILRDARTSVAILGGRWGSVPFYLNRNDVALIDNLDDPQVDKLGTSNQPTIIYLNHDYNLDELRDSLPPRCTLRPIRETAKALIVQVRHADSDGQSDVAAEQPSTIVTAHAIEQTIDHPATVSDRLSDESVVR
ncbi:MAG: hypothetical protein R3B90_08950 [Planctomycetaceae bacterium]